MPDVSDQREVDVFFPKPSGGEPPENDPFELSPVQRWTSKETPARGAIEALLGNVTLKEQDAGYELLDTAQMSIGVLAIHKKVATIDFYSGGKKTWMGDLSPAKFRLAVERTLLQFDSVDEVTVALDGAWDFDSLGSDEDPLSGRLTPQEA